MRRSDVVVVGGGLIGLSVALAAARRGMSVTVLEAETAGRHASSATAGGVRSLNRDPAEIGLARAALPLWERAAADLGRDVGFVRSGQIRVAEDAAALAALERRAAMTRALGHRHEELIGPDTLRNLEPGIAGHCLGALVVRDDGFADPLRTLHAYRAAACAAGAELREGVPATALVPFGADLVVTTGRGETRAQAVVNAAGAWGGALAEAAGEAVPTTARALQMCVTAPLPPFVRAVLGSQGRKLSLKQFAAGHAIIGGAHEGTIDAAARTGRPLPARVAANLVTAANLFPRLREARIVRTWAGIEGWTADGLPVIGPSRTVPGLLHAFGFSGHGFALAPLIGPLLADIIAGEVVSPLLDPFAVDRFPARQTEHSNA